MAKGGKIPFIVQMMTDTLNVGSFFPQYCRLCPFTDEETDTHKPTSLQRWLELREARGYDANWEKKQVLETPRQKLQQESQKIIESRINVTEPKEIKWPRPTGCINSGEGVYRFWPEAHSEKQVLSSKVPPGCFNLKLKSHILTPQKGHFRVCEGECDQLKEKRVETKQRRQTNAAIIPSQVTSPACVDFSPWNLSCWF